MSVIVYIDNTNQKIKKSSLEAVSYAAQFASRHSQTVTAVVIGKIQHLDGLAQYGADHICHINGHEVVPFDSQLYTHILSQIIEKTNAKTVIMAHTANAKCLAGRISVRHNGALVSGVKSLPTDINRGDVDKNVFSGKATVTYSIQSDFQVFTLMGNALPMTANPKAGTVESLTLSLPEPKIKILDTKTVEGIVPLPEAEMVVSAGRGLKGPENWGIIEELAEVLGATTACSRPVADTGWRPHHEHVGQTGVAIRPNLYIAIGISGAIQHLAGVNSSKTIVVINKDPEAPFFKAADYGIVGDLFDIVPKLTASIKSFKAASH